MSLQALSIDGYGCDVKKSGPVMPAFFLLNNSLGGNDPCDG